MLKKNILTIIGIIFGLIAGYLYYKYKGCISGTCIITSKPLNSSLYGALMDGLVGNLLQTKNNNF